MIMPAHLAGAGADLDQLGGAVEAVHLHLPHVAAAAVDLHGVGGDAGAGFGGVEQGGGGELVDLAAAAGAGLEVVDGGERLVGEALHRLDADVHVGELLLDHLELAEGAAELAALAGVGERELEHALGGADRDGGGDGALEVEAAHQHRDARVLAAHEAARRDAAVVEDELAGRAAPAAHLLELLRHLEAGEVPLDEEGRDALGAALGRALRVDEDHVGDRAVGDVDLAAAQQVVVAVAARGRWPCCRGRRSRRRAR